jgi:hypothetical protein
MKLCYVDESGTGDEPIAVMVGVLVDAHRMHITKQEWCALLDSLGVLAGAAIKELHTRNFYSGNGVFRNIDGTQRAKIISAVFDWLCERKHHVLYSSVCKTQYKSLFALQRIPDELNTVWRFLGFHLVLAIQKYCQREPKNKGNTLLIFDNEHREQMRFTDVLMNPRPWSGEYYAQGKKQGALDQVIDVPYFGDSQDVSLIQLADFLAFFLRRYAEIKEGLVPARYAEEEARIDGWMESLVSRSIGTSIMYPKINRNKAADMFYSAASESIRTLG